MMDLFLTNMQLLTSHSVIDRRELCGFIVPVLSAVGLSFWRHPFTAEDPLVSKQC